MSGINKYLKSMENEFLSKPILNSPYEHPSRHWELDDKGQPTHQIIGQRRRAEFITPIPKPKKRKGSGEQQQLFDFEENDPISSADQRYGSETRKYLSDFIVRVDDGHGDDDLLNLIVEIKGYRREDAKDKKSTMDTYWVPGVNNLGNYGRWAFAEFTEGYQIETDFAAKVEGAFNRVIEEITKAKA
jgi:hypothetical protein